MKHRAFNIGNHDGFTLLEIAIVMVIIGILTGGGVSLMKVLTERKARNETMDYLQQARAALISFTINRGRLPWADGDTSAPGDGLEDSGTTNGHFPYLTLQMAPTDPYRRVLRYALNANLTGLRLANCAALNAGLSVDPRVVDSDGSSAAFNVAAVLVSAGPMNADGSSTAFDAITTGPHRGDNSDGAPNYLRFPPGPTFDDLTVYISANELFGEICEKILYLAVNNNSGALVHVFNASRGIDLGTLANNASRLYEILSGTAIEVRNGAGTIVASTPPTPIILAGQGATINCP